MQSPLHNIQAGPSATRRRLQFDGNVGTKAAVLSCLDAPGQVRPTMQDERDVWNTTYFHRAVRKTIGEALSQAKAYNLSQPLPESIRTLLDQLDEPAAKGISNRKRPTPAGHSR
jgi:hypothetical protein